MMNPTSPERIRQDSRLIGQTLLKLALPRLIVRAVVVLAAVIVWLLVTSWLLDFGRSLSFEGLHALGQQTIDLLTRLNPYFWWGVVLIWSLIVFFSLRGWLAASIAAARARPLDSDVLVDLRPRLAEESVDVLRWVWGSRDEPYTVGDLRRAHHELRHNRIGKIALVRQQSAILDEPAAPRAGDPPADSRAAAPGATPVIPAVVPPPASHPGHTEPTLGTRR